MNRRNRRPCFWAGAVVAAAGLWSGCGHRCSTSVPDAYPLGAVNRAHYQTMETNGEAADFILHRNDFVANTADLSPYGKDHVLEIAARARCVPFPVLVERSEHNASPQLDERRRAAVVQILSDCGLADASQRTFVSPAYGQGLAGQEFESSYRRTER